MAAKRFAEAEDAFAKAATLMPEDKETQVLLQEARDAKQKQLEADYQQAMTTGRDALKNKNYQRARDAAADALRLKRDDKDATALGDEAEFFQLVQRGHAAMAAKRYRDAVEACTAACKLRPESSEGRELRRQAAEARRQEIMPAGRAALEAKQYEAAFKLFTELLRVVPDDKEAVPLCQEAEFQLLVPRGQAALEAQEYVKAVTALARAALLKPDDAPVRDLVQRAVKARNAAYDQAMATGNAALRSKDYRAAVTAADKALGLLSGDADDAEAVKLRKGAQKEIEFEMLVRRGEDSLDAKQPGVAIEALEAAIKLKPDDPMARELLGKAQLAWSQLTPREQALEMSGAYGRLARGRSNRGGGRVRAQVAPAKKRDYDAKVTQAQEALARQDLDEAIKKLRMAKEIMALDEEASNLLAQAVFDGYMRSGKIHLDAKQYNLAIAQFLLAQIEAPSNPKATEALADAQAKKAKNK
jgi:tetratricopeptide (TPR) repeat protein